MLEYDRALLGQILKEYREKADATQSEVAERLGYATPQFISNIERGVSVAPLPLLNGLISLYKVKPDRIIKVLVDGGRKTILREFGI